MACTFEKNLFEKSYMTGLPVALVLLLVSLSALAQQPNPGPSPQPVTRHTPQAKTQPEYADYNAASAISGGAAMEKAANDFAAKYPDSELRSLLYSKAMHNYQAENNPAKMLAMGEKVLAYDPDNPVALVLTATALSDNLTDNDPDRATKMTAIQKNAWRALQTIDSTFVPPAGATPEQIKGYKDTL